MSREVERDAQDSAAGGVMAGIPHRSREIPRRALQHQDSATNKELLKPEAGRSAGGETPLARRLLPLLLLIAAGALAGLSTDLAKIASDHGLSPFAFLTWSVAGSAIGLDAIAAVRGRRITVTTPTAAYFFGAALLTVVVPRLLMFTAIPRAGASFVAVSIAFPPLYTYGLALLLRMERFDITRAVGVGLALAGSLLLALLKLSEPGVSGLWIALTLVAPLFLAMGNIYRTLYWPSGLAPDQAAPGMVTVAGLLLLATAALPNFSLDVPAASSGPILLIMAHATVLTALYLVMFELQKRGGPVFLSLMGAIAAIVGSGIAIVILNEPIPQGILPAGLLIATGIGLVNKTSAKRSSNWDS